MGLFSSLNVGTRGLNASQLAIDTTGQNISNANTEGYSRQRLQQSADVRPDGTFGQLGMGVEVTSVERMRDAFLDSQLNEHASSQGYDSQVGTALQRLEGFLNEPSDQGLSAALDKFWNSWQDLANNPEDAASREAVRASTTALTDDFHTLYTSMDNYRRDQDTVLAQKVEKINSLISDISKLNGAIADAEVRQGQHANDSRDQRDLLVNQLSGLIDIQTVEDPHGRISITAGGNLIVGPTTTTPLELYTRDVQQPGGTTLAQVGVRFSDTKRAYVPQAGELRGVLDVRDAVVPKYMADLDAMANALKSQVNAAHNAGFNLNKLTGVDFFDPASAGARDISLSAAVLASANNIAAGQGGAMSPPTTVSSPADFAGVPAQASPVLDLKAINPAFRDLAPGSVKVTLAGGTVLQEGAGADYVVDYNLGTITFINYARYAAGAAVSVDFKHATTGYPGDGDGENALQIAKLRQAPSLMPDPSGNPTQSLDQFYSAYIGRLGTERAQNDNQVQTRGLLIKQLKNEQDQVAGVSIDEEMSNMIKYEHSYQASARFIGTIEKMLDTLMNM